MVTVWLAITDATRRERLPAGDPRTSRRCIRTALSGRRRSPTGCLDLSGRRHAAAGQGRRRGDLSPADAPCLAADNVSDRFRWSFDVRYNVTGQPTGRSHFPEFVARSVGPPDRCWTDWRAWPRPLEAARDAARPGAACPDPPLVLRQPRLRLTARMAQRAGRAPACGEARAAAVVAALSACHCDACARGEGQDAPARGAGRRAPGALRALFGR